MVSILSGIKGKKMLLFMLLGSITGINPLALSLYFKILLPIVLGLGNGKNPVPTESKGKTNTMKSKDIKALIADDSQFMRQLITEYLMGMGVSKTFQASNGEIALEIIKKNTDINLILCDWSMPKLDGLSLVEKTKKLLKGTYSIVLITSENSPEIINQFKKLGVNNILIKPFSEEEFQKKLGVLVKSA